MRLARVLLTAVLLGLAHASAADALVAIAYHDIVDNTGSDRFALSKRDFRAHLQYLQKNGYQPVSLADLERARRGTAPLPPKPVLLSFDDGLKSYNETVVPLLVDYGYPSVLSIVTGWLDGLHEPPEYRGKLMSWNDIRLLQKSPLVEVASHSHDLHRGIPSNPQGNVAYAGITRQYLPAERRYETEAEFSTRVRRDLTTSIARFEKETGRRPPAITWPYGMYDAVVQDIADNIGLPVQLSLDPGATTTAELPHIRRILITSDMDAKVLSKLLDAPTAAPPPVRYIEFDLDRLVGVPAPEQDVRLSALLDNLYGLKINTVIVSPVTRDRGRALFATQAMPSAGDIFNRATHQIRSRLGIRNIVVRARPDLPVRDQAGFYGELARLNRVDGVIFDGAWDDAIESAIRREVRRYQPHVRFGRRGPGAQPAQYDFLEYELDPARPVRESLLALPEMPDGMPHYISMTLRDEEDIGRVSRAMYELRAQGMRDYGYRYADASANVLRNPRLITELSVASAPVGRGPIEVLFFFVFFYPLFMAIFWIMGAVIFYFRHEKGVRAPPTLDVHPRVSILVPCHNEELVIRDTIDHLASNNYPNYDIIAIDDGSSDRTGELLKELAGQYERLRVVSLTRNYGKAKALRAGALASQSEFLMCIDADALLDRNALFWMMQHFLAGPRVGAVTGNPRVLNRNGLLPRIQIGEFSAIVGMIKRTQRSLGRLFTVSGVNACYRKAAVHQVGYWSSETVTEDVDISWRLQLRHWDIRYEPKALTWILVPETLRALWRQRLRWAKGGFEAATRYAGNMRFWVSRRMWTVFIEYWLGVIWSAALCSTFIFYIATQLLPPAYWPDALRVETVLPGWTGVVLAVVCMVQFAIGLSLDSHYEKRGLLRYLFWAIWYPALYWLLNAATTLAAVPMGVRQLRRERVGTWRSPERESKKPATLLGAKKQEERRGYFQNRSVIAPPTRIAELLFTLVFWGLWTYLILPLLSLFLWFAGIYLFTDRMIAMGGYQVFADQLVTYAGIIAIMWVSLTAWVLWNMMRYGRRDHRNTIPSHVSRTQLGEVTGLGAEVVDELRNSQLISMYYREDQPVVEEKAP
jgi:biofilm PGA synthesis N-glycosyltransferase PgaC